MSLRFAFWPVRPDVVRSNLVQFTAETGIAVDPVEVDGDYCAGVWKSDPDVLYAQRGEASLWMHENRIQEVDDLPGASAIVREMYPVIQESSRTRAGKLIGLTYYNAGPFCLFRNQHLVGSSTSNTWEEIGRETREAGSQILMRWFAGHNGLPWALLTQAYSEGEQFIDTGERAVFGPGSALEKVLADWLRWWREELVPWESLHWSGEQLNRAWHSGRYAFFPNMDYEIAQYPGWTGIHPCMPGAQGDSVLPGHALLCIRRGAAVEEAWKLVKYLGYRNSAGELATHKRWIETMNLWVPFPELYRSPVVHQVMRQWLRPDQIPAFLQNRERARAAPVTHVPWFLDWSHVCERLIRVELLQGTRLSPRRAVVSLRRHWEQLRAQFHR